MVLPPGAVSVILVSWGPATTSWRRHCKGGRGAGRPPTWRSRPRRETRLGPVTRPPRTWTTSPARPELRRTRVGGPSEFKTRARGWSRLKNYGRSELPPPRRSARSLAALRTGRSRRPTCPTTPQIVSTSWCGRPKFNFGPDIVPGLQEGSHPDDHEHAERDLLAHPAPEDKAIIIDHANYSTVASAWRRRRSAWADRLASGRSCLCRWRLAGLVRPGSSRRGAHHAVVPPGAVLRATRDDEPGGDRRRRRDPARAATGRVA
jgi:hypothetical protein